MFVIVSVYTKMKRLLDSDVFSVGIGKWPPAPCPVCGLFMGNKSNV